MELTGDLLESHGDLPVHRERAPHIHIADDVDLEILDRNAQPRGDEPQSRPETTGQGGAEDVAGIRKVVESADRPMDSDAPRNLFAVPRDDRGVKRVQPRVADRPGLVCDPRAIGLAAVAFPKRLLALEDHFSICVHLFLLVIHLGPAGFLGSSQDAPRPLLAEPTKHSARAHCPASEWDEGRCAPLTPHRYFTAGFAFSGRRPG